jgi:hypothetical protein
MRRTLVTAALLALALAGCGAGQPSSASKFDGDQAEVAKVVDNLAAAGRARDAERICNDILAKQLVDELKSAGGDCLTEMDRAIKDASDFDLRVKSVKVDGNNATAEVSQGERGRTATFTFVKQGQDGWRATALGGP